MRYLRLIQAVIGLAVLIAVAGCNAAGYQRWQGDDAGPTHSDTGGGDGGGSM